MLTWIFAALGVYLISIYLPASRAVLRFGATRMAGPRDDIPEPDAITARARRAQANLAENLPLFLTPAILSFVIEGADQGLAVLGAQFFVVGRLMYIPAYLSGVWGIRSLCYGIGLLGCAVMSWALV